MLKCPWLASLLLSSIASAAAANAASWSHFRNASSHLAHHTARPLPVKRGVQLPPHNTVYTFDQFIDHQTERCPPFTGNPSLGTFKERYFFSYEFYEKGRAMLLVIPGEESLANRYETYVTNQTIYGAIAQATKGAVVVLEHRFFGQSNPYPNLSEESLRFLTLEQVIDDLVHFAWTAVLPMPGGESVGADTTAWLLMGGSYAGALVNWAMNTRPGFFWAGYSSSGVIEVISNYWRYWEPIRLYMPRNCSADVQRVIRHVDRIFTSGSQDEVYALKARFGMPDVTHLDDHVQVTMPFFSWQSRSPSSRRNDFTRFCDALEVKDGVTASENGWGLKHAVRAFGEYMRTVSLPHRAACLSTYTRTASWTDTAVDNSHRSWNWLLYFPFTRVGAPYPSPTLVSRLITPTYYNRQCSNWFPKTFPTSTSAEPRTWDVNAKYGGWNLTAPRVFFVNGKRDPWREATVSSDLLTDLPSINDSERGGPLIVLHDGYHCNDIRMKNAIDPSIARVHYIALQYFKKWVEDYQSQLNSRGSDRNVNS
ncbi:hypothetical protein BOTBODRAFT_624461 [Botryobasidium botryosum FD-172 SS1]|uniref:Peptidase S28 n=1 Tax=Botryobasidium botryosum (strain FD-172 SS1) TaxID=930990 RepID=A0A067MJ72_BOTB1|nr:hypothetical protein BOTBODRAFT_624461 [Botryobasidium botryosum FD-172 SS1]